MTFGRCASVWQFSMVPHRTGRPLLVATTTLLADSLKGIDKSTVVGHLITPDGLRALWGAVATGRLLSKTVERLPASLAAAIRPDDFTARD